MNDKKKQARNLNGLNIFLEENGMFSKVNFISLKGHFCF